MRLGWILSSVWRDTRAMCHLLLYVNWGKLFCLLLSSRGLHLYAAREYKGQLFNSKDQ